MSGIPTGAEQHGGDGRIRIVAALIDDGHGQALLVRKHGSPFFMQPGGKREPGEDALATLARELREELGVGIVPGSAHRLGEFEHDAVNEPGCRVQAEVFALRIDGSPQAQAEIAELRWVAAMPPYPVAVAPLSATCILPLLATTRAGMAHVSGTGGMP
ncbi:NUDIX domain-containing protein [Stenotrophomonas sp. MMGLT7]|uniref:NUDIX hydrolase n=1 Tax=Stenotrophomonas sp. MMGLT7 TaxID=2901227 RepID=UPI001E2A72CD|nr:NUDIX domain-containing protein [Stenotrophomonas sp. MMGLT7]MCD7099877.1 NUDIX domain-containing protein [Stenotrophomonas sp. MMGLT7]